MGLLARIVQPFPMVVPVPLAGPTTFGGSVKQDGQVFLVWSRKRTAPGDVLCLSQEAAVDNLL